jgi:hypothetical protein
MAQSNEFGTILGLGIVGVGVWFLGDLFGWWGGLTTATTTASTTSTGIVPAGSASGTTTTQATVTMTSTPTLTSNDALQALFVINGANAQNIAVIPGGDAYNSNGQDITATLAAEGVTPAQLYSMMEAKYTPASSSSSSSSSTTSSSTSSTPDNVYRGPGAGSVTQNTSRPVGRARGVGQYRRAAVNYVRRGAAYR